jgi:hypothetical protein
MGQASRRPCSLTRLWIDHSWRFLALGFRAKELGQDGIDDHAVLNKRE